MKKINPIELLKVVNQFEIISSSPEEALDTFFKHKELDKNNYRFVLNEFIKNPLKLMVISTNGVYLYGCVSTVNHTYTITEYEPITQQSNPLRQSIHFSEFEVYLLTNGEDLTNHAKFYISKDFPYLITNHKDFSIELQSTNLEAVKQYLKERFKPIILTDGFLQK